MQQQLLHSSDLHTVIMVEWSQSTIEAERNAIQLERYLVVKHRSSWQHLQNTLRNPHAANQQNGSAWTQAAAAAAPVPAKPTATIHCSLHASTACNLTAALGCHQFELAAIFQRAVELHKGTHDQDSEEQSVNTRKRLKNNYATAPACKFSCAQLLLGWVTLYML